MYVPLGLTAACCFAYSRSAVNTWIIVISARTSTHMYYLPIALGIARFGVRDQRECVLIHFNVDNCLCRILFFFFALFKFETINEVVCVYRVCASPPSTITNKYEKKKNKNTSNEISSSWHWANHHALHASNAEIRCSYKTLKGCMALAIDWVSRHVKHTSNW